MSNKSAGDYLFYIIFFVLWLISFVLLAQKLLANGNSVFVVGLVGLLSLGVLIDALFEKRIIKWFKEKINKHKI